MDCVRWLTEPKIRSTPNFYTCFGRLHVKIALLLIIVVTFSWDLLRWSNLLRHQYVPGWPEIITEVCDAVFGFSLIVAYLIESGPFLLPYIFMQLFTLVVCLLFFALCVSTIIWTSNPWKHLIAGTSAPGTVEDVDRYVRLRAFEYSVFPLTLSLVLVWVIRVLLACYCYFQDQKVRTAAASRRPHSVAHPVETEVPNSEASVGLRANGAPVSESAKVTIRFPSTDDTQPSTAFANENFTISDEDDEDQLWPTNTNAFPEQSCLG